VLPAALNPASVLASASRAHRGEKSRLGLRSRKTDVHRGFAACKSRTALGLREASSKSRVRSRCTGKERDTETGLDYFGARYYASNMGRWMSPDWSSRPSPVPYASLGNPQTLNLYAYVGNNPVTSLDGDGHQLDPWTGRESATLLEQTAQASEAAYAARLNSCDGQAQQQSSGGFWHGLSNLLHGHSWGYSPVTTSVTTDAQNSLNGERLPNPYVAVGADALGIAGAATGHPGGGRVGAAISVLNDPGVPNLVMTGMSFVPVVGEAVGAVPCLNFFTRSREIHCVSCQRLC
jgi:RHS repeat-associated protein